jgi:hypothetical protein
LNRTIVIHHLKKVGVSEKVFIFLFSSPIYATLIYDNFDTDDTYDLTNGATISTKTDKGDIDYDQGISFVVTGSGYYLDTIEFSVGIVTDGGNIPLTPNKLDAWLAWNSNTTGATGKAYRRDGGLAVYGLSLTILSINLCLELRVHLTPRLSPNLPPCSFSVVGCWALLGPQGEN